MPLKAEAHSTAALSKASPLTVILDGIAAADRLAQRYEATEKTEKSAGNHFPANYFATANTHQCDVMFGLLEVMPYLPATNLVEATAQVAQAINVVDRAFENAPDEFEAETKQVRREIERLLHSAIRLMEATGNFSLKSMGLGIIRNGAQDPWADVEQVVQDLKAAGVK